MINRHIATINFLLPDGYSFINTDLDAVSTQYFLIAFKTPRSSVKSLWDKDQDKGIGRAIADAWADFRKGEYIKSLVDNDGGVAYCNNRVLLEKLKELESGVD